MKKDKTLTTLVEAAVVALALENASDQSDYSAIWKEVRRVIVRHTELWIAGDDINDEILTLANALNRHGILA